MVASQSLRELVMILTAQWGSDPHPFGRSALWETHKDIGANLAKKEQPSEITQIGNPWSGHWINCCETILAYLDNLKPIKTRLHSSASIRQEDHDHNHQRLEKAKGRSLQSLPSLHFFPWCWAERATTTRFGLKRRPVDHLSHWWWSSVSRAEEQLCTVEYSFL